MKDSKRSRSQRSGALGGEYVSYRDMVVAFERYVWNQMIEMREDIRYKMSGVWSLQLVSFTAIASRGVLEEWDNRVLVGLLQATKNVSTR